MSSSAPDLPRRAATLVIEYDKTLGQAARILGYSIPTVRNFVQQYLDRPADVADADNSHVADADDSPTAGVEAPPPFVSVLLDDAPPSESPTTIPLDILTPNGLTLRLQLSSLQDVVTLLHSLEVKPC